MIQNEAPRGQPGGGKDRHAGASLSYPQYTTVHTACQAPSWVVSKAGADKCWPGVRSLLVRLGFSNPTPTCRALDWQGCDITATQNGRLVRLGWRSRDRRFIGYRDVTVRVGRPSGATTEVDKLAAGGPDLALWTWASDGVICDWLLVDVSAMRPLLRQEWPVLRMSDATACCIPWQALSQAGAIVTASRGVRAVLA